MKCLEGAISGWWFEPLQKMTVNQDDEIQTVSGKIQVMFQSPPPRYGSPSSNRGSQPDQHFVVNKTSGKSAFSMTIFPSKLGVSLPEGIFHISH